MGFLSRVFGGSRDGEAVSETAAPQPGPKPALTPAQWDDWNRDGFLILRGLLDADDIARVQAAVDAQWTNTAGNDHEVDVLSGPNDGRTYKLHDVPEGSRGEVYKLNNLFARISDIRQIALAPKLKPILDELLEGEPLICNSLNFERGSQQVSHLDTWYMPPPVEGRMVAASLSLDTVDGQNGPMFFYPGSHLIPPYRFSHGLLNEIPAEQPACRAYLEQKLAEHGLEEVEFRGEPGDVFIWHAQLLHGGRGIRDMSRTRRSLVVHYWRQQDVTAENVRHDAEAGYYLGHTLRGEISY